MYAIQIHSLGTHLDSDDDEEDNVEEEEKNIFLDIFSEGQRPRRYFMGSFKRKRTVKTYESIIHFTGSPVTLNLNYGPFRYQMLGQSTIYNFLQNGGSTADTNFVSSQSNSWGTANLAPPFDTTDRQYVTFGQRGTSGPTFKLCYSVRPVDCMYEFALNEITCLKQFVSSWRTDQLYAEVEYNHSPHSIDRGPRNKYKLGRFSTHDIAGIHSIHNLSFSTVSNFVITFYVKSLMSEYIVGTIKFTPLPEMLNNLKNRRAGSLLKTSSRRASTTTGNTNTDSSPQTSSIVHYFDYSALSKSDEAAGGLLVVRLDSEATVTEFVLPNDELVTTQTITLAGASGGSYELLYSLRKHRGSLADHIIGPKSMWPTLAKRYDVAIGNDQGEDNASYTGMAETLDGATMKDRTTELSQQLLDATVDVSSREFSEPTIFNHVELLIDGYDTFKRYYEMMMAAQHSINILAWEINLSFGLILAQQASAPLPAHYDPSGNKWITLEDVLVSKAKEGVAIRIIVWRHELMSHLNRYLYLGEVTIEAEVAKLEKRCKKLGLTIKVFHTVRNTPKANSAFANPHNTSDLANITVIIAGNPKGLISTHHEKLLLIDPECPPNTIAFTGGFDIARGRYDQQAHLVPLPLNTLNSLYIRGVLSGKSTEQVLQQATELAPGLSREERYTGKNIQPLLRGIRFLWHDIQLLLKGPVTRLLHLHFVQRWHYAFTQNPNTTRSLSENHGCRRHRPVKLKGPHTNCYVRLERTWRTVFDVNYLFEDYCRMIKSARRFLYIEHQYPFQNFALTHLMCQVLKANKQLKVIIVTPIKTDLPSGLVGELFDWSQDHIIEHLNLIYSTAPERVGVYGLVNQDPKFPDKIKPIYVHTKLSIVDDQWLLTGSTNMDNVSFFYSSELSVEIRNAVLAKETRVRLFKEHLGSFYQHDLDDNLDKCFLTFKKVAELNHNSLKQNGLLIARVVGMAPMDIYNFTLRKVYYPNKIAKLFLKLGLNTEDVTQLVSDTVENVVTYVKAKAKL